MIKVLFVCTGNICRSPTAEGLFRHMAEQKGLATAFAADSAGTDSYHDGEKPDARAVKVAKKRGVSLAGQKARRLVEKDYFDFDYIYAMDGGHFYEIQKRAPERRKAKIEMFLKSATHLSNTEVPDPWYGTEEDFEQAFSLIEQGVEAILQKLKEEHRL